MPVVGGPCGSLVVQNAQAKGWPMPEECSPLPGLETRVASCHSLTQEGRPPSHCAPTSTGQCGLTMVKSPLGQWLDSLAWDGNSSTRWREMAFGQ